jgi:hypothetical protein
LKSGAVGACPAALGGKFERVVPVEIDVLAGEPGDVLELAGGDELPGGTKPIEDEVGRRPDRPRHSAGGFDLLFALNTVACLAFVAVLATNSLATGDRPATPPNPKRPEGYVSRAGRTRSPGDEVAFERPDKRQRR